MQMKQNFKESLTTTEISKTLFDRLSKIFVSDYYIENILIILKNDANMQKLIDFLNTGETDTEKILLIVFLFKLFPSDKLSL